MDKNMLLILFKFTFLIVLMKFNEATEYPQHHNNLRNNNPTLNKQNVQSSDLQAAAGHHYGRGRGGGGGGGGGGHGGYYQYARVPHYGAWEFGYKRGNPYHYREQHEKGKGHQFRTKLKWGDKHGGYGEHYWDYNHAPKHGHGKHGYGKGYGKHG